MRSNCKGFYLTLSDALKWGFYTSDDKVYTWLKKLSSILTLKEDTIDNCDKKIIFTSLNKKKVPSFCKGNLWHQRKQSAAYSLWYSESSDISYMEVNIDFLDNNEISIITMAAVMRHIYMYYIKNGGGILHCAFLELRGNGVAIAASGGTGKSTCYNRVPTPWIAHSDDNALIIKNKNGGYNIHPMPTWSDYIWERKQSSVNSFYSVPLSGIFFIKQAKNDNVKSISFTRKLIKIKSSLTDPMSAYFNRSSEIERRGLTTFIFNNSVTLIEKIPCFLLNVTLDGNFWFGIEKTLNVLYL